MKSFPQNFDQIKMIDWDFVGKKTNKLTHSVHPYPAKFIPQIPHSLIQELSVDGDTVGDIFCGSGTTLAESLLLNRNTVGIDANPLACLISRAKTSRISQSDVDELTTLSVRSLELFKALSVSDLVSHAFVSNEWRPDFPKLNFWFETFVIEELAEIRGWCLALSSPESRNLALTAFSSIIVAVSHQDSDTRYVRRDKGIKPGDTCKKFSRAILQAIDATISYSKLLNQNLSCTVIEANLLDEPIIPKLDLMVCSPPYPNAFSYHLYHMTRMLWLSMDQPKFKQEEIGSHRKYSKKGKNAATVETFKAEFKQILNWLSKYLKVGGHACFVIGDSTLKGVKINNTNLISEVGIEANLIEVARVNRTMQSNKKSFNPVIGKIKNEDILILENRGHS